MCFVSLGNSASGPAIEIDAPSSVQKPPLIFRRGYVPAQCRRKLEISGQGHFSARRRLCPREPGSVGGGARHGADAIVKFAFTQGAGSNCRSDEIDLNVWSAVRCKRFLSIWLMRSCMNVSGF